MINGTAAFGTTLTDIGQGSFTGSVTLDLAALFVLAFGGPIVFWLPASTEVLCAMAGGQRIHPILVGLVAAAGQSMLMALLYVFGERMANRIECLRKSVDRVSGSASKPLLRRGKHAVAISASAIGFPPTVPLFTLAPSLNMRLTPMMVRCSPL